MFTKQQLFTKLNIVDQLLLELS